MKLSAVIVAKNEEVNIRECLESVSFCDEVVVVDSGSSDKTADLAVSLGAKVYQKEFTDFSSQKNFGIGKAGGDWVLLIDADERVTPELAGEIKSVLASPRADGYYFPRKNRLFGRWMKYGANRGDWQLRLVKKDLALFQGVVHERIYLKGPTSRLKNLLIHYSTGTVSAYMRKLNIYSSLEANILKERSAQNPVSKMKSRPLFVFIYRTLWQGGILDGLEGFIFGVLSGYYEFIRRAKYWEITQDKHE